MDAAPTSPSDRGIVDVVLALHHAPALRFELRERALPADLELVLRLAAPSQPLLDDTASQHGEAPATLQEAARFYLQQVLFEPGTDAYRVLGVPADAPFEAIREHHQWLQRWLHPDRGDAADAPFAARLNWAWQQLRNERKRNAYNVERAHAPAATQDDIQPAPARASKWTTVPVARSARPGRWWRRAALAMAFGSCLVLFVIALMRGGPPAAAPADDAAFAPPAASEAMQPTPTRRAPRNFAAPSPATSAGTLLAATKHAPIRVDTSQRLLPPTRVAKMTHTEPAPVLANMRVARRTPSPTLPIPPTLRAAVVIETSAPPSQAPTVDTAPHTPTSVALVAVQTSMPAAASATSAASTSVAASPAPAVDPAVLLQRVELARQRVAALVDYFRSADQSVPDWRHAPAPFNAPLQRAALRERNGIPDTATFTLDQPEWRMGASHIAMDAGYHVRREQSVIERGHFQLRMVWQDNTWQVTHLQLDPRG